MILPDLVDQVWQRIIEIAETKTDCEKYLDVEAPLLLKNMFIFPPSTIPAGTHGIQTGEVEVRFKM